MFLETSARLVTFTPIYLTLPETRLKLSSERLSLTFSSAATDPPPPPPPPPPVSGAAGEDASW